MDEDVNLTSSAPGALTAAARNSRYVMVQLDVLEDWLHRIEIDGTPVSADEIREVITSSVPLKIEPIEL